MLSLTDPTSVSRAISDPELDPALRALLALRADTKVFVVQGGDTPEVINAALGLAITGDHAEELRFDWIEDHGRWFEIALGATRIFVENDPGTELGIHYLCLSHFWPDGGEVVSEQGA